jgi:hypothetical protein
MCLQTLYLLLQSLDLGIRIVNELIHLLIERRVLFGKGLGQMSFIYTEKQSVRPCPLS